MKNKKGNVTIIAIIIVIVAITMGVIGYMLATKTQAPVRNKDVTISKGLKAVSIKKSGDINYFIYTDENGEEAIIDKAPWDYDNWQKLEESGITTNISDIRLFLSAKFSPLENYLLLTQNIYEGGDITNLYDIKNKENIEEIYATTALEFTPDEKYLISCSYGRNSPTAKIYKTSGFKEIYNLFGKGIGEAETQFYNGYRVNACNWDVKNNRARFNLEKFNTPSESKEVFFKIDEGI